MRDVGIVVANQEIAADWIEHRLHHVLEAREIGGRPAAVGAHDLGGAAELVAVDAGRQQRVGAAADHGQGIGPAIHDGDGLVGVGRVAGNLPTQGGGVGGGHILEQNRVVLGVHAIVTPIYRRLRPVVVFQVRAAVGHQDVPGVVPGLRLGVHLGAHAGEVVFRVEQARVGKAGDHGSGQLAGCSRGSTSIR